ncbi:outer membrane protein [Tenacibaculum sp. UWU-22]|uniref:outer membrane protein n=1 Tax=Tenacibaculum sp. UWU-22 TaxID=3234187 RepID=UPI0034DB28BD
MKTKNILLLVALLSFSISSFSQNSFSITYNFGSLGSKDLKNFVDNSSWRGWQYEYQYRLKPQITLGLLSGYQGFYEKRPRQTYTQNNTSINAVTWRYFTNIPLLVTSKYYFKAKEIKPYIGVGIGLGFSKQEIQVSDYLVTENNTNFGLLGEGGLEYNFNSYWGILFNAKYNYSTYNPDDFDANNMGYLTLGLGLKFDF